MSRCIHCTRCVRFGQEVAGVMELGMSHRGEHAEIETFVGQSVDSELSGNMIDICPVGALTSKPFRYSARTWELSRRKSVSPHDSTGANLIVQVKNNKVMRVVPLENEAVNECWIADRDRFSYEALNSDERLTSPMLKQGGEWKDCRLANRAGICRQWPEADQGRSRRRQLLARWSVPHSTLEELYLAAQLMRGLGSENIDYRLRNAEFPAAEGVRCLGTSIASLSQLQRVLVVGSNLRKDHPLFAQRIRQAARKGCAVSAINSEAYDWAMPVANTRALPAPQAGRRHWPMWLLRLRPRRALLRLLRVTRTRPPKRLRSRCWAVSAKPSCWAMQLRIMPRHPACWRWPTGLVRRPARRVGYLTEAANTVGAQLAGALPRKGGLNAGQMLAGGLKAVILLNNEPEFDSAGGARWAGCQAVPNGCYAEPVQGQYGIQRCAAAYCTVH